MTNSFCNTNSCFVTVNVEMGGINDDEVPCCSKDLKREDDNDDEVPRNRPNLRFGFGRILPNL